MALFTIENVLVNFAFVTLFISMLVFWGQLSFSLRAPWQLAAGNLGLSLANASLFGFLLLRWVESHHFPLSNLYESLIFLSWSLTFAHFILGANKVLLGAITAPSAFFINAFASLTLPEEFKWAKPLVPALQSNWLMMHVSLMILSYSFLILGSLLALCFLIVAQTDIKVEPPKQTSFSIQEGGQGQNRSEAQSSNNQSTLLAFLDDLSYRTLGFGFPLLTIGILSGAIWANQAWGSYWSWDPKETWALITWGVFAIYFHLRLNKAWTGEKPAQVATLGFFLLWICYLGVNLLGKGLHSYGWFS